MWNLVRKRSAHLRPISRWSIQAYRYAPPGKLFFGRPFVKQFALSYLTVVCLSRLSCLSISDVGVLGPNGWVDHDATWYGGRLRPRPHCVRWAHSSHPQKKRAKEPPTFQPMSIVTKRLMDQDATWYEGRPRPRRHCVSGQPSPPSSGKTPILGTWIGVFKPNSQIMKTCIETTVWIPTKFCTVIKTTKCPSVGGPNTRITNPRWRMVFI